MDISKELARNQTVLLLMSGVEYNKIIVDTIKKLDEHKVCYLTMNRTVDSLRELFRRNKISTTHVFFVDVISKSIKEVADKEPDHCLYLSPGSLTEVSLAISELLRQNFDYFIFDSLTNLFSYKQTDDVEKFILTVINKVRETSTKAVLYALNEQEAMIPRCCMFVDKTLVIGEKEPLALTKRA